MNGAWQAPAELSMQPRPRVTELTMTARWLVILALVITGVFWSVGVFQTKILIAQHRRFDLLTLTGLSETAHVSRTWSQREGKSTAYLVSYSYTVDGKNYEGRSRVSYGNFTNRVLGETLPIQYLQDHPPTSRLLIELAPTPYWLSALYFLSPFTFIVTVVFQLRKQKNILETGLAAQALVRSVYRTRNGLQAEYEFTDQAGQTFNGKSVAAKNLGLSEGSIATVIYVPEKPSNNLIYPASFVKIKS